MAMQAPRRHQDWFGFFVLVTCAAIVTLGIISGKNGITISSPTFGNGSQWHLMFRYGAARLIIGTPTTAMSGQPAGFKLDHMADWRFEWWYHLSTEGTIWSLQIPIWFIVMFLSWYVVRRARQQMRLASGVCPNCGRATGGAAQCPKCRRILVGKAV